jgi:hypothetical protein
MNYKLYDVTIDPLPNRQAYITLFTSALASSSDAELDAATPATWAADPYRLWVLAFARELKAYAKRNPYLISSFLTNISKNNRYQTVNIHLNSKRNNYNLRYTVLSTVLNEAISCIYNGTPGEPEANNVHLIIATTTDGKYAGHITYYDNPTDPTHMIFISIYKSVYCKDCKNFSDTLLDKIEEIARSSGKRVIGTSPIGPMENILLKHGFGNTNDGPYTKLLGGGKRNSSYRSTRKWYRNRCSRSRSRKIRR